MTKRLLAACLVAGAAFAVGCEDRPRRDTNYMPEPKSSNELGRDVGAAAREAKEDTEELFDGVKDGFGGSGTQAPERPPDTVTDP